MNDLAYNDALKAIGEKEFEFLGEKKKLKDTVAYGALQEALKKLNLYETALQIYGEDKYESRNYSCSGYFCTPATTSYPKDELKKICSECLSERLLQRAAERIKNESK